MGNRSLIRLVGVSKTVGDVFILKDINLEIRSGQTVGIIGASGSGKSSLLYILGLLDSPSSGDVFIEDTVIKYQDRKTIEYLRNKFFGFIFQFHYLVGELTAIENVMLPSLKLGVPHTTARKKAIKLLAEIGLSGKENRKPYQLSGGEQQRVAICRALINDPTVILADEPTGNLDSENSENVMRLLRSFTTKDQALIVVTHDSGIAQTLERQIRIRDGKIIFDSNP